MNVRPTARRGAAVVLAVALGAVAWAGFPAAAQARSDAPAPSAQRSAIVDCIPGLDGTAPPQSMAPGEVAGAFFDPSSTRPPAAAAGQGGAQPGAGKDGAPPNTLASYGWAGFSWPDYEPGCSATISLDDRLTGTLARASLATLVWANAATTGASRYAYDPATYDPVDQLASSLDSGIGDGFARPGFWIVVLLVGAALVWTADRRSPRHHAQAAGLVLVLGLSVVTVGTWNATLGPTTDKVVLTVVSWANTAATPGAGASNDAGQQIGESMRSNIVLRTWRNGMFGPNDSTADQYGDALFAAGAISSAEAAAAGRDSEALGKLADADKSSYEQLAAQVKQNDERAYDYLAGKHNGARLFYATLGWFTWLWAASFQTVAAFATAYALTLVRLVLGLWSAIALVALFRPRYALRAVGLLVGSLVAGIGLSVVAAGARLAYGQLLSTAVAANTWVTLGVGLVLCVATWVISWPLFRVLPGTPERLRRLGMKPRASDDATTEVIDEPAGTSGVGPSGTGLLGDAGDPGVPAEASPGRTEVGVLAAASEGLPGRRRRRPTSGAAAVFTSAVPVTTAPGAEPAPASTQIVLPDAGGGAGRAGGSAGPAAPGGAGGPTGTAGPGTAVVVRSEAPVAADGTAPADQSAAAQRLGAEARPSGRLGGYGPSGGSAASGAPGTGVARVVGGLLPRPPRKVVPVLYPVHRRPPAPTAPDLLVTRELEPPRARPALPAEASTDRGGDPRPGGRR